VALSQIRSSAWVAIAGGRVAAAKGSAAQEAEQRGQRSVEELLRLAGVPEWLTHQAGEAELHESALKDVEYGRGLREKKEGVTCVALAAAAPERLAALRVGQRRQRLIQSGGLVPPGRLAETSANYSLRR
jgi:hypothetical protein